MGLWFQENLTLWHENKQRCRPAYASAQSVLRLCYSPSRQDATFQNSIFCLSIVNRKLSLDKIYVEVF